MLMFLKFYHFLLTFILIISTSMVFSSSSWLISWFALEINLMSFIPIILIRSSPAISEASIKYFLTQALASSILIFASISTLKFSPFSSINSFNNLILIALGVKSGMAPTHFWFPQVMELINWTQGLILLTWQKIAPLILMFSLSNSLIMNLLVISSAIMGALGGFNINSIKKIITFSSIAHLAWMAMSTCLNFKVWIIYFLIYSFISASLVIPFHLLSVTNLSTLNIVSSNKLFKIFIFFNLLSLGGLPPLLGIFPKIIVIFSFVNLSNFNLMIMPILILSSVITLFFYTKIIYSSMTLSSIPSQITKIYTLSHPFLFNYIMTFSILGNLSILPLVLLI
uniref:NADH-ubiquinone oxidoreductase chain 2 n=1 Tax=Mesaphorura yosii TaxID=1840514 RepID=A0A6H0EVW0_9HEXA|nr:NADH dehydrogenase subunit 2 [Mesaphorura yosii]